MSEKNKNIYIVTEHGNPNHFNPYRKVVKKPNLPKPFCDFFQAVELVRRAYKYKGTVVFVTYGNLTGFSLAWLQTLLRPLVTPKIHLMFDLLLEPRRCGLLGLYDRFKMYAFCKSGTKAVVWGKDDPEVFSREYEIPRNRFQFHPYHTTLDRFKYDVADDGYIFAGGNSGRDYVTLINAVRDIDYPVVVATTKTDIPPLAKNLSHVTVRGVSDDEFRSLMARCTFLVETHSPNFFRTTGHQTMLNAMSMRKPIILADRRSAPGYFESGVEGIVVDAGDVSALASAIQKLIDDSKLRERMGAAGRARTKNPLFSTALHMQSIYNLALRLEYMRNNSISDNVLIDCYGLAESGVIPMDLL